MKLVFIVDPLERLDPTGDSTVALVEAAQDRGHNSWVTHPAELTLSTGHAYARARAIRLNPGHMDGRRWVPSHPWHTLGEPHDLALDETDAVFVRMDPPVDRGYLWATYILDHIDPSRVTLINDPRGIRHANEKLFCLHFADLVPPTLVCAEQGAIRRFVEHHGRAVAKPIDGHAGRGVVSLDPADPNLASLIELMTGRGAHATVIQAWVEAAGEGNKRIVVYDGEILGAVNRLPEPGEFRTGAPCATAPINERDHHIVTRLAPTLHAQGLRLVGLDVIGDRLVELNVTSPGGIRQAEGLGLAGMAAHVIERLEFQRRRFLDHSRRREPSGLVATAG